jgi:hypothetical protein
MTVALPLVISLAVMAYAWPASRIAPRDLPVGIVGTSAASQNAVEGLAHSKPGGFDFHLYPDEASARSAMECRPGTSTPARADLTRKITYLT